MPAQGTGKTTSPKNSVKYSFINFVLAMPLIKYDFLNELLYSFITEKIVFIYRIYFKDLKKCTLYTGEQIRYFQFMTCESRTTGTMNSRKLI